MHRTALVVLVLVTAFLLAPAASFAADPGFLRLLPIVSGDSQERNHSGWLTVRDFSWEGANPAAYSGSTSGGLSAGKVKLNDFEATVQLDRAYPRLMVEMAKGTHFDEIAFHLVHPATGVPVEQFYLRGAIISSLKVSGGDQPEVHLTIAYAALEIRHLLVDSTGKATGEVRGFWNVAENTGK